MVLLQLLLPQALQLFLQLCCRLVLLLRLLGCLAWRLREKPAAAAAGAFVLPAFVLLLAAV